MIQHTQYINDCKIFTIICFLGIALSSTGQEYIPMNFEDGVWINELFEYGGHISYSQFYCNLDTIVDNQEIFSVQRIIRYPKRGEPGFDYYGPTVEGYIYENESKQIMYRYNVPGMDYFVAYDFNIELGDTIAQGWDTFIVNEIDSVEICGKYHKRYIYTMNQGGFFPYTLTEGIGYSNGLLGFVGRMDFEEYEYLYCFTKRDNPDCAECEILVGGRESSVVSKVYPIPASGDIIIDSEFLDNRECRFLIYDNAGRLVSTSEYTNSNRIELDVSTYDPGIYYYKLQTMDNRQIATGKFIVEY